jgi:hypothetical protein
MEPSGAGEGTIMVNLGMGRLEIRMFPCRFLVRTGYLFQRVMVIPVVSRPMEPSSAGEITWLVSLVMELIQIKIHLFIL